MLRLKSYCRIPKSFFHICHKRMGPRLFGPAALFWFNLTSSLGTDIKTWERKRLPTHLLIWLKTKMQSKKRFMTEVKNKSLEVWQEGSGSREDQVGFGCSWTDYIEECVGTVQTTVSLPAFLGVTLLGDILTLAWKSETGDGIQHSNLFTVLNCHRSISPDLLCLCWSCLPPLSLPFSVFVETQHQLWVRPADRALTLPIMINGMV